MPQAVAAFFSLYLATLLLLVGSGLFNSFIGLKLTADAVSEVWVGALMAVYYLGLVLGARTGHKLIIGVGHIRAYAANAAVVTVAVLVQALIDNLWVWLTLRFVAGLAMVTLFMALESWLNEQTENQQRGKVFAFYMVFSGLGTVLGQLSLGLFPSLDMKPLVFVAICSALCLIPVALTRRLHPALQLPAPIQPRYYLTRVPLSLTVLFVSGTITGAFYGLAPVYAARQGLATEQVAVFLAAGVASGLLAQWPMGWLADRLGRVGMIRLNAALLTLLAVPLWGWWAPPYWALLVFSCVFGILQFTLYPLGVAFANDNIEPERRVGLSAIVLMVYGLGACLGPLAVGVLMNRWDSSGFYIFVSACSVVLVAVLRPRSITGDHLSQDAPTQFVPMADNLQATPVAATLDPRVDPQTDISHEIVPPEEVPLPVPAAAADGETPPAEDVGEDGRQDGERGDVGEGGGRDGDPGDRGEDGARRPPSSSGR